MPADLTIPILICAAVAYIAATFVGEFVCALGFTLPPAEKRIGCIDGLRGYLALSVLFHHFVLWMQVTRLNGSWTTPDFYLFNQMGKGAVALFFMITGLVFYPRITIGFRHCVWPAIYISRIFRIIPLIAVSVAVITAIIAARTGRYPNSNFLVPAALWIFAGLQAPLLDYADSWRLNAGVLWSIRLEWVFYILVLPACALAMDLMRSILPTWMLPLGLLVAGLLLRAMNLPIGIVPYLQFFAIGMVAYECQQRPSIVRALRTPLATLAAVSALGVGTAFFEQPYNFSAAFLGFFFICVTCGNSLGGLLTTRGALVLGECSYGIYLMHGIILNMIFVDGESILTSIDTAYMPIILPFAAIALALITPITYLIVERPAILLGAQISRHWVNRRVPIDPKNLRLS